MNLIRKGHRNTHRGVIGIEAAIVLIAFVIVAAALAFVVLNMGFATTQKAKTSITTALGEAGSSLSISGKVVGHSKIIPYTNLTAIMIPVKLTSGGENVDLNTTRATISYLSADVEYNNIFTNACTLNAGGPFTTPAAAWQYADTVGCIPVDENPINGTSDLALTTAIIYWAVGGTNTILEQGEHAVISLGFNTTNDAPVSLDKIKAELTVTGGATLTVERDIPNISSNVTDLG